MRKLYALIALVLYLSCVNAPTVYAQERDKSPPNTSGQEQSDNNDEQNCFVHPIPGMYGPNGSFPFGGRNRYDYGGVHRGVDYIASMGTEVVASGPGTVVHIGNWPTWATSPWVNTIWIEHKGEIYTRYTHLWGGNYLVSVGDQVQRGQVIGYVGPIYTSGSGNADHVDFGISSTDPRDVNGFGVSLESVAWLDPGKFTKCVLQNDQVIRLEIEETDSRPVATAETNEQPNLVSYALEPSIPVGYWGELLLTGQAKAWSQRLMWGFFLTLALVYGIRLRKKIKTSETKMEVFKLSSKTILDYVTIVLICAGMVYSILFISVGPLWAQKSSYSGTTVAGYPRVFTSTDERFKAASQEVGMPAELLHAFYAVSLCRDQNGLPTEGNQECDVFPPHVAAAIMWGETNAQDWGTKVDMTTPGYWGQYQAWYAAESRWPANLWDSLQGRSVSQTAYRQQLGLTYIGKSLGIDPTEIYGSSAAAIGRTQVLPSHYAPGGVCEGAPADVWNDPLAVAECTTRHLAAYSCSGRSYLETRNATDSLCGYNPGAWGDPNAQWYWDELAYRSLVLERVQEKYGLDGSIPGTYLVLEPQDGGLGGEYELSTSILLFEMTKQIYLNQTEEGGQVAIQLTGWQQQLVDYGSIVLPEWASRFMHNQTRYWVLLFYEPQDLIAQGINP